MTAEINFREQLVKHLEGGLAYASIDSFLDSIPFEILGKRPKGLPYSFYEVFYHIVFAQKDILDYSTSANYKEHQWPEDYWPEFQEPETEDDWEDLKASFFEDRRMLRDFIMDQQNDLNAPVKNSEEHTLLRELMLVVEHNAYHTGQLVLIQRLLGVYDN